jgi:succinoglycan biosynthesis protein ExoL
MTAGSMRVLFLFPQLGHPRCHKRVAELQAVGVDPVVLAFTRPTDLEPPPTPGLTVLGELRHRDYLSRLVPFARAGALIRKEARLADIVYCFGQDQLALAEAATVGLRPRPLLYVEVGDIREPLVGDRPKAAMVRAIERAVIRKADTLVVTSEAYISGHYHSVHGLIELDWFLLENKMEASSVPAPEFPDPDDWDGVLRIADQGYVDCLRSWEVKKRLARKGGERVQIHIHGKVIAGTEHVATEAEAFDNIHYHGPYTAPDDLPAILGAVDFAWIAHMYRLPNHLWARANRFYQAGFYGKPMIAQLRTQDGKVAADRDFGPIIDVARPDEAVDALLAITAGDVARWRRHVAAAPRSLFQYSDEHVRLRAHMDRTLAAR